MEALRSCTRYRGPGEGHLLELSVQLHMLVRRFYADRSVMWTEGLDTLISAVPEGFILDAVRHAFITLALDGGAPLHKVQAAAGHADPRTTERYWRTRQNIDDNAVDYVRL